MASRRHMIDQLILQFTNLHYIDRYALKFNCITPKIGVIKANLT